MMGRVMDRVSVDQILWTVDEGPAGPGAPLSEYLDICWNIRQVGAIHKVLSSFCVVVETNWESVSVEHLADKLAIAKYPVLQHCYHRGFSEPSSSSK